MLSLKVMPSENSVANIDDGNISLIYFVNSSWKPIEIISHTHRSTRVSSLQQFSLTDI